jgi:hypothetical protein
MDKVIGIFAAALAFISVGTAALSQTACEIVCAREDARYSDCNGSSVQHGDRARIGIVGKVINFEAEAYCNNRLSIDVLQASMDSIPTGIKIDFDPCINWRAQVDDVVNIDAWQRPSPSSGACTLAPCPN